MKKNTHRLKANKQRRELTKRLAGYSLAAGAALAGAQTAEATIIYSSTIPGWESVSFGPGDIKDVTLEGSNADLRLLGSNRSFSTTSYYYMLQGVGVGGLNGASVQSHYSWSLKMLGESSNVGPSGMFGTFATAWARYTYNGRSTWTWGPWTYDGQIGFFGFKFELESNSTTVYGWGELKRLTADSGELLSWAYEDSGAAIHVPEPSGLALLALGAGGLAAWRSRRRKKEA